jgi:hypothetical protein
LRLRCVVLPPASLDVLAGLHAFAARGPPPALPLLPAPARGPPPALPLLPAPEGLPAALTATTPFLAS